MKRWGGLSCRSTSASSRGLGRTSRLIQSNCCGMGDRTCSWRGGSGPGMVGTGLGGTGASWAKACAPAETSRKARYTKATQRYVFTSTTPLEGLSQDAERFRSVGPPPKLSHLARLPLLHEERTTHNGWHSR